MTGKQRLELQAIRRADIALWGVYEVSKILALPERLETTLAKVLHLLASFLDMRHGLIALLDHEGAPKVVVGAGWSESNAKRYFERLPERAIGSIVVTAMPVVIEDIREDPLFESMDFTDWDVPEAGLSFVGVPIKDRGQVIGTLTIDRERGNSSGFDQDIRLLSMIANMVGQTVRLQTLIARDRERLLEEQNRLTKLLDHTAGGARAPGADGIVGVSAAIRAVTDKIRIVARSNSTVLLRGESGTGKELFARALHDASPRRDRAFVALNCAALPESVLESELFGHEKGSFTGALAQRKGRFELADGGTLFLDEIGDISPAFQAKLLRVLQEGELERVGGSATLKVDVRVVAATNRNLEQAVAAGTFRADLYYRISVVPIFLPPLRDRPEDIAPLAREFLRRFNDEHGAKLELDESALAVLGTCAFPGNVRELENCVRRTATFARTPVLAADDFACKHDDCLSSVLWNKQAQQPPANPLVPLGRPVAPRDAPAGDGPQGERQRLIGAMESAGWVQAKAARLLGLSARQIGYALRKHRVEVRKF